MRFVRLVCVLIVGAAICVFLDTAATASPIAEFTYTETSLGGGIWQYDYTLSNTSNATTDPGADLYDLVLHFDSSAAFSVMGLPNGWDPTIGSGFAEFLSLNQGTPPTGTDIGPGESLGGFSFQFDYRAGALRFDTLFVNIDDFTTPFPFSGTTSGTGETPSPVPEPSILMLFVSGLAGLGLFRTRYTKASL